MSENMTNILNVCNVHTVSQRKNKQIFMVQDFSNESSHFQKPESKIRIESLHFGSLGKKTETTTITRLKMSLYLGVCI